MKYLFDTSSFIAWWHEIYPVAVFKDIAKLIANDIENLIVQSPIEVKKELEEKVGDELTEWVKTKSNLFIPTKPELHSSIADISNAYPRMLKQKGRVNADPVIIALAQSNNATVVTQENPAKHNI